MSATLVLQSAVGYLRALMPADQVPTVAIYGGEFNAAEVGQLSYAAPAVLVTALGWRPAREGESDRLTGRNLRIVSLAAFCAFKHTQRPARLLGAMQLAERVATGLRLWVPALGDVPAQLAPLEDEPECENLYSRAMDEKGQGLWMVRWSQAAKQIATPEQMWDLLAIEIIDTTRQGVTPATTAPAGSLTVTEDVQFARPYPPT